MKIFIYSIQGIESTFLASHPEIFSPHTYATTPKRLTPETAALAAGSFAVLCFVNDDLSKRTLSALASHGIRAVLLRCAGFDRVDAAAAASLSIPVLRVPSYSPHAVAEHAVALLLALNRGIVKAALRAREHDFYLRGLVGRNVHGKTVGVVGTGQIGCIFARLMLGFGTRVLAYDLYENKDLVSAGVVYVDKEHLLETSDFVSLHCPLLESTRHIINEDSIAKMKEGAMLINCGRGGLVETKALVEGLRSGKLGGVAMDVYEHESGLYFNDHSDKVILDSDFLQLQGMPNCLITPHIAFCTDEALQNIWETTRANLEAAIGILHEGTSAPHPNQVLPPSTGTK